MSLEILGDRIEDAIKIVKWFRGHVQVGPGEQGPFALPELGLFITSAPTDSQMKRTKRRARKQKRTLPKGLDDAPPPEMTLSPAKENLISWRRLMILMITKFVKI